MGKESVRYEWLSPEDYLCTYHRNTFNRMTPEAIGWASGIVFATVLFWLLTRKKKAR